MLRAQLHTLCSDASGLVSRTHVEKAESYLTFAQQWERQGHGTLGTAAAPLCAWLAAKDLHKDEGVLGDVEIHNFTRHSGVTPKQFRAHEAAFRPALDRFLEERRRSRRGAARAPNPPMAGESEAGPSSARTPHRPSKRQPGLSSDGAGAGTAEALTPEAKRARAAAIQSGAAFGFESPLSNHSATPSSSKSRSNAPPFARTPTTKSKAAAASSTPSMPRRTAQPSSSDLTTPSSSLASPSVPGPQPSTPSRRAAGEAEGESELDTPSKPRRSSRLTNVRAAAQGAVANKDATSERPAAPERPPLSSTPKPKQGDRSRRRQVRASSSSRPRYPLLLTEAVAEPSDTSDDDSTWQQVELSGGIAGARQRYGRFVEAEARQWQRVRAHIVQLLDGS